MKMMEINEQETKERKRKKIIIVTILASIFILSGILFCFYLWNKPFRNFMDEYVLMKNVHENHVNTISLEESENYQVYAYDKYISILRQNTLTGYTISGKKEYELTVEISNPIVDSNNRFFLIAEQGKQKIYLISGNSIVWEKEVEGNISRVSVNKNGYVSVVLSGTTHKSVIQTFDATGNPIFKTFLSNSIAMDTDISYDNKYLSIAEISTDGTLVQSRIKIISIPKAQDQETVSESIVSTITAPSDYTILNLKYQEGNKLICMYDQSIQMIENGNSEEIFPLQQQGQKITFADIELNNYAFRITEKNVLLSTESTVELLQTGSKKINQYTIDSVIKEIYDYEDILALNLGSEVHFVGVNGWLIKKYTSSQEVRKIVINSHFAGIIYRDKIEIVEL